jgi:predicted AlkP superfamily phosphohydrolase/phosphomutase
MVPIRGSSPASEAPRAGEPVGQPRGTAGVGRRLVVCAALCLMLGCAAEPARVTLVGVDGATWSVIDPMLERGELPNFRELIDAGVRAPLRSELPLASAAIWTTIATGVGRDQHAIRGFIAPGGGNRFISSGDRKAPALWTIAHAEGLRSAVIGWWGTFPAEAIDGVVISERALKTRELDVGAIFKGGLPRPEAARLTHPPEVLVDLAAIFRQQPEPPADLPEPQKVRINMHREDASCVEALLVLRATRGPFDLEMVLLRGIDPVSHFFWKYHAPDAPEYTAEQRPTREQVERLGETVREHYRHVDALLGRLRRDEPKRIWVVISDHGFEAGSQPFRGGHVLSGTHTSESALDGIFVASGGPLRAGAPARDLTIYDIAPLSLYLLGLPVSEDLEGSLPTDLIDSEWLAASPVATVARYELDASGRGAPDAEPISPVDEELRAELEALGYIE